MRAVPSLMSRRWKIEEYGRNGNDAHLSEIYRSHEDFFSLAPARFLRRCIPTSNKRLRFSNISGVDTVGKSVHIEDFLLVIGAFWYGNCSLCSIVGSGNGRTMIRFCIYMIYYDISLNRRVCLKYQVLLARVPLYAFNDCLYPITLLPAWFFE